VSQTGLLLIDYGDYTIPAHCNTEYYTDVPRSTPFRVHDDYAEVNRNSLVSNRKHVGFNELNVTFSELDNTTVTIVLEVEDVCLQARVSE
jgi:hypothetical protein